MEPMAVETGAGVTATHRDMQQGSDDLVKVAGRH